MITLTKRQLLAYSLLGILLCLNIYFYLLQGTNIKARDLAFFNLDAERHALFAQVAIKRELALINVNGSEINYYYPGKNFSRLQPLLQELQNINDQERNAIANGDYFISLHDGLRKDPEFPVLAFAASAELVAAKQIVLIPDHNAIKGYAKTFHAIDRKMSAYPWQKRTPKIFWRGATTGADHKTLNMQGFARGKFLEIASQYSYVDAAFTSYTNNLNPALIQQLKAYYPKQKSVAPEDAIAYRYLLDIDGNSCSYARMAWILYSKSLLLKQTSSNIQWYYHKLKPYVNYVPLANDFSDLPQQFNWIQEHPLRTLAIVAEARKLAEATFSPASIRNALRAGFNEYHANAQ